MAIKAGPEQRREWVLGWRLAVRGRLVRYARRLVADEEAARDIVQHAFLRLCGPVGRRDSRPRRPWLFRVCRNKGGRPSPLASAVQHDERTATFTPR